MECEALVFPTFSGKINSSCCSDTLEPADEILIEMCPEELFVKSFCCCNNDDSIHPFCNFLQQMFGVHMPERSE